MSQVPARTQDIARALLAETSRSASGLLQSGLPLGRSVAPKALIVTPMPLREANPDRAHEIYQGQFSLAGVKIEPGARSPFLVHDAPAHWRRAVASFSWLGDLSAAGSELSRVQARCLISDWMTCDKRRHGPGWEVPIVSQRLISWLNQAPFYLTGANGDFHSRLMASIGRQARYLAAAMAQHSSTWAGLCGAIAYNYAVVCTDGLERQLARAAETLSRALHSQILPDGGHISRNPAHVIDLLEMLLPLKHCFVERDLEPPDGLITTIDRLFPLLRLFLHGDGGLAFFNGASETRRRLIATLLAEDVERAKSLNCARQSGYTRLAQGKTVIIADTGTARSARASDSAHAGALAFEMSHGTQRIIVNCGHAAQGPDEWRVATRATAAHSALVISERSSARVFDGPLTDTLFGGPLTFGPASVTSQLQMSQAGGFLSAAHDGYLKPFGLTHHREIYLASSGTDIRGEDRLVNPAGEGSGKRAGSHPFAIHFHLHPSVKATLSKDSNSVLLMLPDKSGWRFSARGALITLDESVYFVDRDVPHRTVQIVLFAETSRTPMVQWALKMIEKAGGGTRRQTHKTTRLPLRGGGMNESTGQR